MNMNVLLLKIATSVFVIFKANLVKTKHAVAHFVLLGITPTRTG